MFKRLQDNQGCCVLFFKFFLLFSLLNIFKLPISPMMPGSGLDPSWKWGIDYAFFHNLKFGNEIAFTFGPLGNFWDPLYSSSFFYVYIFVFFIVNIVIVLSFVQILKKSSLLIFILSSLAFLIGIINGGYWFIFPILFILLVFKDEFFPMILAYILAFMMAFSTLVKFSHAYPIWLTLIISDIYKFWLHRQKPRFFPVYIFFLVLLFLFSGQNITDFPGYIKYSLEVGNGFSEAMQYIGSKQEIYAHMLISMIGFGIVGYIALKEKSIYKIVIVFCFFLTWFITFKSGFVRHDGHAIQAFGGLAMIAGLLYPVFLDKTRFSANIMLTSFLFLCIFATLEVSAKYHGTSSRIVLKSYSDKMKDRITNMKQVFSPEYKKGLDGQCATSIENIKKLHPLPNISGTVDIYPWDQSYIIAHGLNYRPRPLFQSYSVYTQYLLKKNRDFLKSDKAPNNILFNIAEIDGRLPSSMEGASWIELITRYDAVDIVGDFLYLKKAKEPQNYEIKRLNSIDVEFENTIELPKTDELIWAKIELKKSFLGKLYNTLYQAPILQMYLVFEDGHEEVYRMVPEIVKNGFLLTPFIKYIFDFYKIDAQNFTFVKNKKVKAIKFSGAKYYDLVYKDKINIKFYTLNFNKAKNTNDISTKLKQMLALDNMLNSTSAPHNPHIETYKKTQILFSHLPSTSNITIPENTKYLKFGYGIIEEAYRVGDVKGACFKISAKSQDQTKEILKKCVDPKRVETDRGILYDKIQVDKDLKELIFETLPNESGSGDWGWTFWCDVEFEK